VPKFVPGTAYFDKSRKDNFFQKGSLDRESILGHSNGTVMQTTVSRFVDLSTHVGTATLTRLVLEAIRTAQQSHPNLARGPCSESSANPWEELALLTYCYAKGIFASRQIAVTMKTDCQLSSFCGGDGPERDDLAWFRRHNRVVLQECLGRVLQAAYRLEHKRGAAEATFGYWPESEDRDPVLQANIDKEVAGRIARAVELDCISRDW
jgi:hypothetical protein